MQTKYELLPILFIACMFVFITIMAAITYNEPTGENITTQQYRNDSLQYLEDIRSATDYLAAHADQNARCINLK